MTEDCWTQEYYELARKANEVWYETQSNAAIAPYYKRMNEIGELRALIHAWANLNENRSNW